MIKFKILRYTVFIVNIFFSTSNSENRKLFDNGNLPYSYVKKILEEKKGNVKYFFSEKVIDSSYRKKLNYDIPLFLYQDDVAYSNSTYQKLSVLSLQNQSLDYNATIFVNPSPLDSTNIGIYFIPSNCRTSIRIIHNWNGSVLKVANISEEPAIVKVSLF